MHIPDGYLSPSTCAVCYGISAPFWYVASARIKRIWDTQVIPLLSVFAAFSFVIMMFNLPLPGGTTGHAVGMSVAAIVLGPWAAMLAVSLALFVQAVFFGDGGITAIGANCLNMAIVGSLVAYGIYRLVAARSALTSRRRVWAAAIAGYLAINASALVAAVEFGIQPVLFHDASGAPLYAPYPLSVAVPAMMLGHVTIAGLAEMVITAGIVAYLQHADPMLLRRTAPGAPEGETVSRAPLPVRKLVLGLAVLLILTPLGILATGTAWGEWGAEDFADAKTRQEIAAASGNRPAPAQAPSGMERLSQLWRAPLPDYAPAVIRNASAGYLLSALAGSGLILLLGLGASRLQLHTATGFLERTLSSLTQGAEHAFFAEEIARSKGLLQSVDARAKMLGFGGLIVAAVAVQRIEAVAAILAVGTLLGITSGVGIGKLASRVWLPVLAFTGVIALPAIFAVSGDVVARLTWVGWGITAQGLQSAVLLTLRALTAATFSVLLVLTTPWNQVLLTLRTFRIPPAVVLTLGMTYRYIFLLLKSAHEMFESRRSRMVGKLASDERRRVATSSAGVLLAKSLALSSEVHLAMQARGFRGEVRVLDDFQSGGRDWIFLAAALAVSTLAFWFGR